MKKIYLALFIFGIPILGLIAASWIKSSMNAELHRTLMTAFPNEDPAQIEQLTVGMLCAEHLIESDAGCSTYDALTWMQLISILSVILGFGLLVSIGIAGRVARLNRRLLLWLFKPGLYFTALGVVILTILDAGIAMGTIFFGESALVNRVHVYVLILIALGAVYGVVGIIRNVFTMVRGARVFVAGVPVSKQDSPLLWKFIENLAHRQGSLMPDHILVGLEPNFFVTDAHVEHLNGKANGRVLYCSLPLMEMFDQEEFAGVIGHELGHYKGKDVVFSRRFYPIYRGVIQSLEHLEKTARGWRAVALLPALAIFAHFLEAFAVAERSISRQRELLADKEGAKVSNPKSLAVALLKLHAVAASWDKMVLQLVKDMLEKKPIHNVVEYLRTVIQEKNMQEQLQPVLDSHVPHPTASHPPLKTRLEALGYNDADIESLDVDCSPKPSAASLLGEHQELTHALFTRFIDMLSKSIDLPPSVLERVKAS